MICLSLLSPLLFFLSFLSSSPPPSYFSFVTNLTQARIWKHFVPTLDHNTERHSPDYYNPKCCKPKKSLKCKFPKITILNVAILKPENFKTSIPIEIFLKGCSREVETKFWQSGWLQYGNKKNSLEMHHLHWHAFQLTVSGAFNEFKLHFLKKPMKLLTG